MSSATTFVARKRLLFLTAALLACAAWYAAHLDLSLFVSDDGGITLRYAERIAAGRGFNYNDGEAINGASNPLYTLLLALNLRLGLTLKSAISAIAVPAFAATTGLLFYTFARHGSLFAGVFSLLAFWSTRFLFTYLFDALEPTLTLLLAALLFHALHTRSFAYQGIALGLLVANKLDGSFAAIGFAIVWLLSRRRFPIGAAVAAFLTALPMFLLLLISFGSMVPNSALQKARFMHTLTGGGFHPLWVSDTLRGMVPSLYMPALMSFLLPGGPSRNLARYVIQL